MTVRQDDEDTVKPMQRQEGSATSQDAGPEYAIAQPANNTEWRMEKPVKHQAKQGEITQVPNDHTEVAAASISAEPVPHDPKVQSLTDSKGSENCEGVREDH